MLSRIAASPISEYISELAVFAATVFISITLVKKKRFISALVSLFLGILWTMYLKELLGFLDYLGADSLDEAREFNIQEALFLISTLKTSLHPYFNKTRLLAYTVFSVTTYWTTYTFLCLLKLRDKNKTFFINALSLSIVCVSVCIEGKEVLLLYRAEKYATLKRNYMNSIDTEKIRNSPNLIVYIGESTSVMNMGIYGYQRNTTPKLNELLKSDQNLLLFHNVFSTHTLTSNSLLEALSFSVTNSEDCLPIYNRRRISLVDVLQKGGLKCYLISNQEPKGKFDLASQLVFRNSENLFSQNLSKTEYTELSSGGRPMDDEVFEKYFIRRIPFQENSSKAVFLHSYAGHGEYLDAIPEKFRHNVDDFFDNSNVGKIFENSAIRSEEIEAYDSALRYVDYSISKILSFVKELQEPTVFVYFSDHGEAVFARLGHDSGRFVHEMARIPFLIYFNDAARREFPELFEKYSALSKTQSTSSLAQFSSTLLDIAGLRVKKSETERIYLRSLIGEATELPPILVRETRKGYTYVNINSQPFHCTGDQVPYFDATDNSTREFTQSMASPGKDHELCGKQLSSFEQTRRNELVHRCNKVWMPAKSSSLE